ncbi:MAG TPA: monofunctional biosynthetic peptidoglycan transglycosylase [Bryobacteraceae bacterium]|nr:monofunctional biosynthetic peptidoglycan transglycosylase [Bryobacteraceae bacterium]
MSGLIRSRSRGRLARLLRWTAAALLAGYALALLSLAALRWFDPLTTAVHIQRRIEALVSGKQYRKEYTFVPSSRIAPSLQHAVVTAEDARFYQHHGIDWQELQNALDDELDTGRLRGASTITQQLVKNLLFTTHRNPLRKIAEWTLAPAAEPLIGKQRILELYLNVVEWGPGVYGAEAAARHHYGVPASRLTREQAARLAAILPSPRRRKPQRMDRYSAAILHRMAQTGW